MKIEPTTASLRALLTGLIDYAGLFPPASLDLETSARHYVDYVAGPDRWILRSFVCPATRLRELRAYLGERDPASELRVTALAPPPSDGSWEETLDYTFDAADRFDRACESAGAYVESFELKISARTADDPDALQRALSYLVQRAESRSEADYFVEITPAPGETRRAAEVVSRFRDRLHPRYLGLKLRTGGVKPADVPSSASVAEFICSCRDNAVPFKATAGLHHPLYHHSDDVGTMMHGFLNVFAGSIVAAVHGIGDDTLARLLQVDDLSEFVWTDDGFNLGPYRVSVDEIREVRGSLAVSFGSCSFDEPRDDLLTLGLATSKS
jgi:hypothetical protein